jgi:hypothetical protein
MSRQSFVFALGVLTGGLILFGYSNCSTVEKPVSKIQKTAGTGKKRSVANAFSREQYAPYTFTLKVNGQEMGQRWIRDYFLGVEKLEQRGPAAAFETDAMVMSLYPREAFPKPLEKCSRLILILDEKQDGGAEGNTDLANRYVDMKERLQSVRGFEVRGEIEKFTDGRHVACRTHADADVRMRSPYEDAKPVREPSSR